MQRWTQIFFDGIEAAIAIRFLRAGNILVLDNAANHTGKGNTVLKNWLWEEHSAVVLFLPAQALEWNPIELTWNCLTQRLKYFNLSNVTVSHHVVESAATILESITCDKIYCCCENSGVFNLHSHK
jgi:hypothetical protein